MTAMYSSSQLSTESTVPAVHR